LALRLNDQLGRTWKRQEEANPKRHKQPKAGCERAEPVKDGVVGAVNEAVDHAQGNKDPRTDCEPLRRVMSGKRYCDQGVEQDWNFKEVPEVVGSLNVFQSCRHLG
jgi:hypothetical protein